MFPFLLTNYLFFHQKHQQFHPIIPTRDGIVLDDPKIKYFSEDGKEVNPPKEEQYPKINYHISDNKKDESFGAKSRFEICMKK